MNEQAGIVLCNLVSRGYSVSEAKKRLSNPQKPETEQRDDLEAVRDQLTAKGIKFHPKASLETLKKKLEGNDLL